MKIYKNKMMANKSPVVEYGDIFDGCNLAQSKAHTVLFEGVDNVKFIGRCNLQNVEIQDGWDVGEQCHIPPHKDIEEVDEISIEEMEEQEVDNDINDVLYNLKYHAYVNNEKTTKMIKEVYTDAELDGVELEFKETV